MVFPHSCFKLIALTVLTLAWTSGTSAQTGAFLSPGPQIQAGNYATSLNFQYGQTQIFQWTDDLPGVRLALWQQGNASGINESGTEMVLDRNNTAQRYVWNGIPDQNLANGQTFFLQIYDASKAPGTTTPIATSAYFNISFPVKASSAATSSSAASSASSSQISTASSFSTTATGGSSTSNAGSSATNTSLGSSSTAPATNNSSTNTLAIGLGVGLGIAILLALLAAAYFFGRYKRKRKSAEAPLPPPAEYSDAQGPHGVYAPPKVMSPVEADCPAYEQRGPQELVAERPPQELQGGFVSQNQKWGPDPRAPRAELY